ncbi:DUF1329 domain-containing protein [Variovorax sp. GT1P44]|uniref:DUF1329 domain-containing protein n=1 Tax=Variovorax sp. GT1P44 TaxID=3443742 RepID=UPI003F46F245
MKIIAGKPYAATYATALVAVVAAAVVSGPARAAPQDARLDTPTVTPVGAERKGNSAGTIPAWEPLTGVPAGITGVVAGAHYPDPFAADKPIATITAANVDQYKERLTAGQMALLRRGDAEKMLVYPTHRSCAYPDWIYKKTAQNVGKAKLSADGNALSGAVGGFPFPFPENGWQIMWNHKTNFYGATRFRSTNSGFLVNPDGSFEPSKQVEEIIFPYHMDDKGGLDKYNFMTKVTTEAPARRKGNALLIHDPLDASTSQREGWIYLTALRRMLRGPDVRHDAPDPDSQGLLTIDQRNMFSDSLERYDWKIVGKAEKYVGYNGYKIVDVPPAERAKVVGKTRISPDYMRYELHRVWVIEATLKPGQRHIYPKRTFYMDEDSWYIVAADMYDAQGKLWRTSETQLVNFYDRPSCLPGMRVNYDLLDDKYYVELWSEKYEYDVPELNALTFSPDSLRRGQR